MSSFACRAALVLLLIVPPCSAGAQLAATPEEAQQTLLGLLQSGRIRFHAGNDASNREYGLQAIVRASGVKYKKSLFGNWEEIDSNQAKYYIWPEYGGFDGLDEQGAYDACTTAVHEVRIDKTSGGYPGPNFDLTGNASLSQEQLYPNAVASGMRLADAKWVWTLDEDPRTAFAGPYFIDWRKATFARRDVNDAKVKDKSYFLVQGIEGSLPYAQISVGGPALADYVENAIRVLQLGCSGRPHPAPPARVEAPNARAAAETREARAQAGPSPDASAAWGVYSRLPGSSWKRQEYDIVFRFEWSRPGEEIVQSATGSYAPSSRIQRGEHPGELVYLDGSSGATVRYAGTVQPDGSVLFVHEGLLADAAFRVRITADGELRKEWVTVKDGQVVEVKDKYTQHFRNIATAHAGPGAESAGRRADPSTWGIYARLAGARMGNERGASYAWSWGQGEEIIEDRGSWGMSKIVPDGPGRLARFYKGKKTWTGTIEPDGSVVWDTVGGFFGVSGDPFRIRLRDGKLVYEYVFIRDGKVVKTAVRPMQTLTGTLP